MRLLLSWVSIFLTPQISRKGRMLGVYLQPIWLRSVPHRSPLPAGFWNDLNLNRHLWGFFPIHNLNGSVRCRETICCGNGEGNLTVLSNATSSNVNFSPPYILAHRFHFEGLATHDRYCFWVGGFHEVL